jgi:glycosyltransferase involved in cell wall biosynthesis
MNKQSFDVVIPCYEPKIGWAKHLISSLKDLDQATPDFELNKLIVVNDGSPIGFTSELSDLETSHWKLEIIEHTFNKGKGAAIRSGMRKSDAPISLFTDIDVPYMIEDMASMINAIASRKSLRIIGLNVRLQQNIELPGLGLKTLLQESRNFLLLILNR